MKSDKEYIECLKNDDFSAFDALFRKYSLSLYAFCISLTHDSFAAEEITQLVFLKVWEKRIQIKEYLSFKSFLFSITYNETISWIRKESSEKRNIGNYLKQSEFVTCETEYAIEFQNLELIAESLMEEMPEKRREIFKMSRVMGFSNKEIADKLNISVKTVENQMTSALKFLRKNLEKWEITGILFFFIIYY